MCKGFGHLSQDCARSYAAMTRGSAAKENEESIMDLQDTAEAMEQHDVATETGNTETSEEPPLESSAIPTEQQTYAATEAGERPMECSQESDKPGKRKGEDSVENMDPTARKEDEIGLSGEKTAKKKIRQGQSLGTKIPLEEVGSSQLDDPGFF